MPNKDTDTPAERIVIIDQAESQRRAAEERLRAQEAGEVSQLDKTIPGGKYQAPDGRWHDAHGREITEDGELASETPYELPPASTAQVGGPEVTDAAREDADEDENAWRSDMKEQRRASMAEPVEGAPIFGDTILPPLEEDEGDEGGDKPRRRRGRK
jgi:hypothetical protein